MMSILLTDPTPEALASANSVLVYSDAPTNIQAIKEIDAWAWGNGFRRTLESRLLVVRRDDLGRCYKGVCFRWSDEDRRAAEEDIESYARARNAMPMTADSALLAREQ